MSKEFLEWVPSVLHVFLYYRQTEMQCTSRCRNINVRKSVQPEDKTVIVLRKDLLSEIMREVVSGKKGV